MPSWHLIWTKKGIIRASTALERYHINAYSSWLLVRKAVAMNAAHRTRKVDVRLYALVDPERAGGHDLAELSWLVAAGGATLVQLRGKHGDTRHMIDEARAIRLNLAPMHVPLLINDRVDVALVAGADGVHVGQDDMPVEDARRLMGPDAIIGLSIKTLAQAEAARVDLIDYAAIGGVYVT